MDLLCFCSVLCLLCLCARLFICALWSPTGKGLTSWLSFLVSNCEFVTFPLVSWVRCGTWLYRFLIFCTLTYFEINGNLIQLHLLRNVWYGGITLLVYLLLFSVYVSFRNAGSYICNIQFVSGCMACSKRSLSKFKRVNMYEISLRIPDVDKID